MIWYSIWLSFNNICDMIWNRCMFLRFLVKSRKSRRKLLWTWECTFYFVKIFNSERRPVTVTESVAEICCVVANLNFVSSQEAELGHEEKLRNSLFIAGGKQPRLTSQFKMYLKSRLVMVTSRLSVYLAMEVWVTGGTCGLHVKVGCGGG